MSIFDYVTIKNPSTISQGITQYQLSPGELNLNDPLEEIFAKDCLDKFCQSLSKTAQSFFEKNCFVNHITREPEEYEMSIEYLREIYGDSTVGLALNYSGFPVQYSPLVNDISGQLFAFDLTLTDMEMPLGALVQAFVDRLSDIVRNKHFALNLILKTAIQHSKKSVRPEFDFDNPTMQAFYEFMREGIKYTPTVCFVDGVKMKQIKKMNPLRVHYREPGCCKEPDIGYAGEFHGINLLTDEGVRSFSTMSNLNTMFLIDKRHFYDVSKGIKVSVIDNNTGYRSEGNVVDKNVTVVDKNVTVVDKNVTVVDKNVKIVSYREKFSLLLKDVDSIALLSGG